MIILESRRICGATMEILGLVVRTDYCLLGSATRTITPISPIEPGQQ